MICSTSVEAQQHNYDAYDAGTTLSISGRYAPESLNFRRQQSTMVSDCPNASWAPILFFNGHFPNMSRRFMQLSQNHSLIPEETEPRSLQQSYMDPILHPDHLGDC